MEVKVVLLRASFGSENETKKTLLYKWGGGGMGKDLVFKRHKNQRGNSLYVVANNYFYNN